MISLEASLRAADHLRGVTSAARRRTVVRATDLIAADQIVRAARMIDRGGRRSGGRPVLRVGKVSAGVSRRHDRTTGRRSMDNVLGKVARVREIGDDQSTC